MAQPLTANMDNINAEEGRCGEEDLVKSFFPSLFDSDSDSEDVYCLHPLPSLETHRGGSVSAHSSPGGKSIASVKVASDLSSPLTKAHSTSLLHLSRRQEALPESGSPHSQENSAHTVFQPGTLEHSNSIGDQSAFHSVVSQASSCSVFDVDDLEVSPLKKRKVEWPSGQHEVCGSEFMGQTGRINPSQTLQGLRTAASAQPAFSTQPIANLTQQGSLGRPLCLAGGITTGVPVDSCSIAKTLQLGRSTSSHFPVGGAPMWPVQALPQHLPTLHSAPQGHLLNNWRAAPAMIPTASVAQPPAPPMNPLKYPTAPLEGSEKIAAALTEISKAPLGPSPLGLKLDKVGVMHHLSAMGIKVTGA